MDKMKYTNSGLLCRCMRGHCWRATPECNLEDPPKPVKLSKHAMLRLDVVTVDWREHKAYKRLMKTLELNAGIVASQSDYPTALMLGYGALENMWG